MQPPRPLSSSSSSGRLRLPRLVLHLVVGTLVLVVTSVLMLSARLPGFSSYDPVAGAASAVTARVQASEARSIPSVKLQRDEEQVDPATIRQRRAERHANLVDFFKSLKGRKVLYAQNPGNGGDALIDAGFLLLAERAGLEFTQLGFQNELPEEGEIDVVLYGGGGNFVQFYSQVSSFIQAAAPRCRSLVILPQTVSGHEELLRALPANVHIWARDRVSYEYMRSLVPEPDAQVSLSHDMAFALEDSEWLVRVLATDEGEEGASAGEPRLRAKRRPVVHYQRGKEKEEERPQNVTRYAFRGDVEQSAARQKWSPLCNEDLSRTCGYVTPSSKPDNVQVIAARMLRAVHRSGGPVYTDRLHIGIATSVVGAPAVYLFPGAYFKIPAIFTHSVLGYGYPMTALVDAQSPDKAFEWLHAVAHADPECTFKPSRKCEGRLHR